MIEPFSRWTAAADSSGNQRLDAAGKRSMIRFVARLTGTLTDFHVKVRSLSSDGPGYAAGTGGIVEAKLCEVNADGTPNLAVALVTVVFPANGGDPSNPGGSTNGVRLGFDAPVVDGQMYAVVLRNADPAPTVNYWSVNYLYDADGLSGAQARNELSPDAPDAFYGLDPREVVGASQDGGVTWGIPGSPENLTLKKHCPVYVQKYASGETFAQPWYSCTQSYTAGTFTMVFAALDFDYVIDKIGVYLSQAQSGSFPVSVLVDDVVAGTVDVVNPPLGHSEHVGAAIVVTAGQVVKLRFVADPAGTAGLRLRQHYADTYFSNLAGLGPSNDVFLAESITGPYRVFPVWPSIRDFSATELRDRGVAALERTTVTYPAWKKKVASGAYPDVTKTEWWRAFDAFSRIGL